MTPADETPVTPGSLIEACKNALSLCRYLEKIWPEVGALPSVQETKAKSRAAIAISIATDSDIYALLAEVDDTYKRRGILPPSLLRKIAAVLTQTKGGGEN